MNKRILFNIHSWIGIKLGLLFFVVCFTGTIATFSHELDWLLYPEIRAQAQEQLASRNQIVEQIRDQFPTGKISRWKTLPEPYLCNIVELDVNAQRYFVFANQYTGQVQGAKTFTLQHFFRDLHYFLFIPFQIGHFIVLFFGFMLFMSLITALLFYKNWFKKLLTYKKGAGTRKMRSLHRLVGSWSIPFCLLFSLTAMWYFVERVNLFNIGTEADMERVRFEAAQEDVNQLEGLAYRIDYDRVVEQAEKEITNFKVQDIYLPGAMNEALYVTGKSAVKLVRNRANRVYMHPITYEVLHVQNATQVSWTTWINDIVDPLHFGNWGGIYTKIIWLIGGLSLCFLVISGVWIGLRRKIMSRTSNAQKKVSIWMILNIKIVLISLLFMYLTLLHTFQAGFAQVVLITVFWLFITMIIWYFFVRRLQSTVQR